MELSFDGTRQHTAHLPWQAMPIPPDITSKGIYIGTSGYYFDDWVGIFNPPRGMWKNNQGIAYEAGDADRLKFYQKYFRFVEINSSYYVEPVLQTYIDMERKSLANSLYVVKVHQSISHTKEWDTQKACDMMQRHITAVAPLVESGRFFSFLIQLEDHNIHGLKKLDYYLAVCKCAIEKRIDVHIEFRDRTWHREAVLQKLKDNGVGICNTDIPPFPHVFPLKAYATTDKGYIRYSGRNLDNWYPKVKAKTPKERIAQRNSRYDYNYSDNELAVNVGNQLKLAQKTNVVAVAYNNHYKGNAVTNAIANIRMLREKLGTL